MIKKTVGTLLYILLAWSLIQSWGMRQASRTPGLDKLVTDLLDSEPATTKASIQTPALTLEWDGKKLYCVLTHDGYRYEVTGEGGITQDGLDLTLRSKGELSQLARNSPSKTLFISGDYHISARLTGALSSPKVDCRLEINNASFENLSTGTVFKDINAVIAGDGERFELKEFRGVDSRGGVLSASGHLELTPEFSYQIDFRLDHTFLLQLDHLAGLFSGKLSLTGDSQGTNLVGELEADSIAVALNETKSAPKSIDVTYINVPDEQTPPPARRAPLPLSLDIKVSASKNIWIHDDNLNSEWKAGLIVAGTAADPAIHGALEMLEGSYLMQGRVVRIKEGVINFDGDPVKNSSLSIIGSLETNSIVAEAMLSGPLTNPHLTLRSNPPLPQAEILSHLIFGHGQAEISPQQSRLLRKSLKDLKAMSTGTNILDTVRSRFGIDRIEIMHENSSELENVSVRIGKYLSKGLYIAFNKGISSDDNRLLLEASIRPDLKLQAEINDNAEGQLHLKWRHDY